MANQPNFDLLTREGIVAALTWIMNQTVKGSISNILISQVINAVLNQAPVMSDLTNIQARALKNRLDSINTGNVSFQNIPGNFPMSKVDFKFKQQDHPDEIVTAIKSTYVTRWLLGEPEYSVYLDENIPADTPDATTYWSMSLPDNQYLVFGGTLGGLPKGTFLGKSKTGIDIQLGSTSSGSTMNKLAVNIKMTNNVPQIPMLFSIGNWGFLREDLSPGMFKNVFYMSSQNSIGPEWSIDPSHADSTGMYKMPVAVKVTVKVNGEEKPDFQSVYSKDQGIYPLPQRNGIYVGNIVENDEVELIFDEYIERD